MMRIARITVEGTSEAGAFSGTLSFGPGVQVISGPNRLGKSIAFAAIVWCLGVEQIYGVQSCDNAIFPDAPRHMIDLGDAGEGKVIASSAEIELVGDDGRVLKLRRPIVGDTDRMTFTDGELEGDLVVGRSGAMGDATAGFQATFRRWAGLPEARLMTSRGTAAHIYFENLAPLFLIEQLTGWADIVLSMRASEAASVWWIWPVKRPSASKHSASPHAGHRPPSAASVAMCAFLTLGRMVFRLCVRWCSTRSCSRSIRSSTRSIARTTNARGSLWFAAAVRS